MASGHVTTPLHRSRPASTARRRANRGLGDIATARVGTRTGPGAGGGVGRGGGRAAEAAGAVADECLASEWDRIERRRGGARWRPRNTSASRVSRAAPPEAMADFDLRTRLEEREPPSCSPPIPGRPATLTAAATECRAGLGRGNGEARRALLRR